MPALRSCSPNPLSKKLDSNAPDGVVATPLTVTAVPSGSDRACAMDTTRCEASTAWAGGAKPTEARIRNRTGMQRRHEVIRISFPRVVPGSAVAVFERGELGFLLPLQACFRTAGEERPAGRAGVGCAQPVAGTRCGRHEGAGAAPQ